MKLSRPAAAAAAAAAVLTAACGSVPSPRPAGPPIARGVAATEPSVSPAALASADLEFGLNLLGAWCAQDPAGNIVLSPSSLASGLGMAYLGARGATARAMAAVLALPPAPAASLPARLLARERSLRGLDGRGVTVAAADQLWTDPSLTPLPGYLNAIATGYGAGIGQVPLLRQPGRAAAQIDAAIGAATEGHISHLLTTGDVENTIFVLTDALYLNARWASPFLQFNDSTSRFTAATGQPVTAHYMFGAGYASAVADGWTAVLLPYRGGQLAMTALLPPSGPAAGGCPDLTARQVTVISHDLLKARIAAIELPKVSLASHQELKGLLEKLGMGIAFAPTGDFSGISQAVAGLGVVVHAATLQVAEAGTVASAATAVTGVPTAGWGGPVVNFDRPYLMLITDTRTGEPLFLARVANPDLP